MTYSTINGDQTYMRYFGLEICMHKRRLEDNIIILRWILKIFGVRMGTGLIWLMTGSYEHDNEPLVSI
jgi:hypothetical protein